MSKNKEPDGQKKKYEEWMKRERDYEAGKKEALE